MLKKHQTYQLTIQDFGTKGEGIGKVQGQTVFVKEALPQDIIDVQILMIKKNYAVGKMVKLIKPSPNRIQPSCDLVGKCGGCQIQSLAYPAQLELKTKKVADCLARIGKIKKANISPIIGMKTPFNYRNKVQFAVGLQHKTFQIGLYSLRTHTIINAKTCLIQHPITTQIIKAFRSYLNFVNPSIYDEKTHSGLIRHVLCRTSFDSEGWIVCVVINGDSLPGQQQLVIEFSKIPGYQGLSISRNTQKGDRILGGDIRLLAGNKNIIERIADYEFIISPASFFQVNPMQTEKMVKTVVDLAKLKGAELIWDLYCGTGLFACLLAPNAKSVIGIESVQSAIDDAKNNAARNSVENIEFKCQSSESFLEQNYQQNKVIPDLVLLDPPRKGCDAKLLHQLTKIKPKKIIYVSCDPATLARDLAIVLDQGYDLKTVQPIDLFPHTVHVETVCELVLK